MEVNMNLKRLVLWHRDADGFGAAYACHLAFRTSKYKNDPPEFVTDDTTYIGVQYNEPLPEQAREPWDEIYIVDFSYPLETLLILAQDCPKVVVIDHHKTAEEIIHKFNAAIGEMRTNDAAVLRMLEEGEKVTDSEAYYTPGLSGAVATWEYFHTSATPDILRYVQDRDLWKWELPHSREVNLYIASLPWDFAVWDAFTLNYAIAAGSAIAAYEDSLIKYQADKAYMGDLDGHKVPFVNCTAVISEVGDYLCKKFEDAPFVVLYQIKEDKVIYSLRSRHGFDCGALAKKFQGGGHAGAAGFSLTDPEQIYELQKFISTR
jgi:oligoribonuclease NrnB/cAMP/cGMP phosphodiesterase (DHH superfamily)